YLPNEWRLTLDLVNEHGHGDDGLVVHDWATSVDVDWRRWFARVAHDPHVNYTPDHQWRGAAGLRFLGGSLLYVIRYSPPSSVDVITRCRRLDLASVHHAFRALYATNRSTDFFDNRV